MSDFSVTEAAFTGMRIVRARPRAVAVWAAFQLVTSLGLGVYTTVTAGPALMQAQTFGVATPASPAAVLALYRTLLPFYAVLTLFSLAVYPVLYAAMNRAVLRPADDGFGYLRVGADEWRQLLLMLLYILVFLAAYIAILVGAVIVGVVVSLIASRGGVVAGDAAGALVIVIAVVAAICVLGFLAVRLSLASALTFATRRVNLFGSWTMTRGRFWRMLGAYLLAFVLAALVTVIALALSGIAAVIFGGGNALSMFTRPDVSSLAAFFSPARIISLVISAAAAGVTLPLTLTPAPAIYRSLASSYGHPGGDESTVESVFS
ncbi:MAG: hypothetical protein ACHP84_20295 [Caulobacterales bacterium]